MLKIALYVEVVLMRDFLNLKFSNLLTVLNINMKTMTGFIT